MSRMRNAYEVIENAKDQRAILVGPASLACAFPIALFSALALVLYVA